MEESDDFVSESAQLLIDHYFDNCEELAQDLNRLREKIISDELNGIQRQPIIVFSHELDINSIITSDNHHLIDFMLENEEWVTKHFQKRIKQRIETNGRKIWFCLKYKNLSESRIVKTFEELESKGKALLSIDFLQIISLSETSKECIATQFVKTKSRSKESKWRLKCISKSNFKKLSDGYIEVKKNRVYAKKRYFSATIGRKESDNAFNCLKITVFMEIFDEKQLQCLYNGSHLESVVLLQRENLEYVMLSFNKICRPVPQLIDNFTQFLTQFPHEFRQLFDDRKVSNYSLALSLAFIFADNISISGSFLRLKLGLLLSLLSINEYPKKNNSSVLVLCDDTLMIRRLFEWTSLLTEYRYFQYSLSVSMTGKSREDSHEAINWVDAGALQLGADGITIIGSVSNLNDLPKKERTALFHALETNEVIARQSGLSEPSLKEHELKTTIWAVIEDNIDERLFKQKSTQNRNIVWTQVFGMVYRIPNTSDNYTYVTPTDATMHLSDWQRIVELMATISPQMTQTAETLLHDYYVSIRRFRGTKVNQISFQTLISLSKSMAKLSLRLFVTKYDALMAILLYEESLITHLCESKPPIDVEPVFHVLDDDQHIEHYVGYNCDHLMSHFEKTLNDFIRKQTQTSNSKPIKQYLTQSEE